MGEGRGVRGARRPPGVDERRIGTLLRVVGSPTVHPSGEVLARVKGRRSALPESLQSRYMNLKIFGRQAEADALVNTIGPQSTSSTSWGQGATTSPAQSASPVIRTPAGNRPHYRSINGPRQDHSTKSPNCWISKFCLADTVRQNLEHQRQLLCVLGS